ncbi:hypothetical protein LTR56_020255 [Elasticomyces elasticus]|nr:hypothetical protein LTR56_020255 [Elasticomyces elasticus]KAK3633465.1 hypothetical protein LTR22_020141 [Elasticomyces elasticus]KAK4907448.1 hypothetical protein LTR49_023551 [Elasticomyces elasticus]KAK5747856.1 hypothetical protein LTS12_022113 [Elasticomyces elasticus]
MPTSLLGPAVTQSPVTIADFYEAVNPVLAEHRDECLRASSPRCAFCGTQSSKALQQPSNSLFHSQESDGRDPSVQVLVLPVCDRAECETAGMEAMSNIAGKARSSQVHGLQDCELLRQGVPEETLEGWTWTDLQELASHWEGLNSHEGDWNNNNKQFARLRRS